MPQTVPEQHSATLNSIIWMQQQMIRHSPFGMLMVDVQRADMPIVFVNQAFERNTGYSAAEILGQNCRILQGTDRQQEGRQILRQAIAKCEPAVAVLRNYRKDGSMFWNEVHISPVLDQSGKVTHFVGVQHDITARKQAELALARSERQYRALFDQSNDAVFLIDLDGNHLQTNQRAADMLGYSLAETAALNYREVVDPGEVANAEDVFRRLRLGEHLPPYERTFQRQDGTPFPVEVNIELVLDADGQAEYFQAIVREISARKLAQQQTFELTLERERAHLLTRFVQDVAHEFRTPLSVIVSSANLVLRSSDIEWQQRKVAQIDTQVHLLAQLVDDLLLMARLETRPIQAKQPIDLVSLLSACTAHITNEYGDKPAFRCDRPAEIPLVVGDADYLAHAFHQILDNAYRFTPPEGEVSVTVQVHAEHVLIWFCDTGIGIANDDLRHVFETFWRRDAAHSTPGFGLGLPIAQRIIERHGGQIEVVNQATQGTCFCVRLPIAVNE